MLTFLYYLTTNYNALPEGSTLALRPGEVNHKESQLRGSLRITLYIALAIVASGAKGPSAAGPLRAVPRLKSLRVITQQGTKVALGMFKEGPQKGNAAATASPEARLGPLLAAISDALGVERVCAATGAPIFAGLRCQPPPKPPPGLTCHPWLQSQLYL